MVTTLKVCSDLSHDFYGRFQMSGGGVEVKVAGGVEDNDDD